MLLSLALRLPFFFGGSCGKSICRTNTQMKRCEQIDSGCVWSSTSKSGSDSDSMPACSLRTPEHRGDTLCSRPPHKGRGNLLVDAGRWQELPFGLRTWHVKRFCPDGERANSNPNLQRDLCYQGSASNQESSNSSDILHHSTSLIQSSLCASYYVHCTLC